MASRTYEDGPDRIIVTAPKEGTPFVEITRKVRYGRSGRWRTEASVVIGVDVWRKMAEDAQAAE